MNDSELIQIAYSRLDEQASDEYLEELGEQAEMATTNNATPSANSYCCR